MNYHLSLKNVAFASLLLCTTFWQVHSESNLNSLNVGLWTTWKIPCGIAVYSENFASALTHAGCNVFPYPHVMAPQDIAAKAIEDKLHILNIQYDIEILPKEPILIQTIEKIRAQGIKVVLTVHGEPPSIVNLIPHVDGFIYMKQPHKIKSDLKNVHRLPLPIPFHDSHESKKNLREKYGFKNNHLILVTIGFMLSHKEFDKNLELLAPYVKENKNVKIQFLTPITPRALKDGQIEYAKLMSVINKHSLHKQITLITDFIPNKEFKERIMLSDLGYQWFNINTSSTSSATREFAAALTPVIIPNSSHYHDTEKGVIKTQFDRNEFIARVKNTLNQPLIINELRKQLLEEYNEKNFHVLIKDYIELFQQIKNS